jgi:hypothetical protein
MTRRVVAVRVGADVRADSLEASMLEDAVDLVVSMRQVDGALVAAPRDEAAARSAAWPGMPVLVVRDDAVASALAAVHGDAGASDAPAAEAAVVCADAPDLPPLLLGKLFSALTSAEVAVCPASDGSLVALAARLPATSWLAGSALTLDDTDAVAQLTALAPRRALHVGSGWHRVRSVDDTARLDPGLEGWDATRAWLASSR